MTLKAYPFVRPLLFYILGLLGHTHFACSDLVSTVCALLCVFVLLFSLYFKWGPARAVSLYILIGCIAYKLAGWQTDKKPEFGKVESYTARVIGATELKPKSYKVKVQVFGVRQSGSWSGAKATALLYLQKEGAEKPKYGDVFLAASSLREIEGPKNPYEFDYRNFQARRGIFHHDFLRAGDYQKMGNAPQNRLLAYALNLNEKAVGILKSVLTDQKALAVAEAMLLGTKDELDFTLRDQYATAGAVHILAVSGLHVGILMLMLRILFGFLKGWKYGLWLFGGMIILCLWAYALFTGMSPSVTRATLMFSLFQVGTLIRRDRNGINVLAGSAFILLLFKPNWLFDVGFQLSYLAIFGILFLYPYLNRWFEPKSKVLTNLWQITVVSVSAQLFTFPLSIYYFHQFPSYFLFTNPLVTVFSMGVLFCGLPFLLLSQVHFLNSILLFGLKVSVKVLNFGVIGIANWPMAKMSGFSISVWEVLAQYVIIMLLVIFFLQRTPKPLFFTLGIASLLLVYNVRKDLRALGQKELAVHFIPKGSGVSMIQGKSATFICDSASLENDRVFGFHLKNYYDARGVRHVHRMAAEGRPRLLRWNWGEEEWLWVKNYGRFKIDEVFDKVLISNNAVFSLSKQFDKKPSLILLDDTNSKTRVMKLKAEADSLGWPLVSLYESGGMVW